MRVKTKTPGGKEVNKTKTKLNALMILPVLACLWGATGSIAQTTEEPAGSLVLRAISEIELVQDNLDGTKGVVRVPAETVVPGDEVIYTLVYDNQGSDPAEDIFITNPIPEHMEFRRAASGPDWLELVYSVDGGALFGPLSSLTMTDSAGQSRQALPQDCTHIRWVFQRSLAPGESGQVSYTTRLL
jgi:uncharacterized repeat protein (TIGR01451 family)